MSSNRPSLIDRARAYLAACPGAIAGQEGNAQTFSVAVSLSKGFDLPIEVVRGLMDEYNQRCDPLWSAKELDRMMASVERLPDEKGRGWLADGDKYPARDGYDTPPEWANRPRPEPPPKPKFDEEALRKFADRWARVVDLVWLANRSVIEPALVTTVQFLEALYKVGENVLIFKKQMTQGDYCYQVGAGDWQVPELAEALKWTPDGVWFLAQPVTGKFHPVPREAKQSRRSGEAVTAWRYLILESDEAPARLWLGALAQLPLRIAAIYTSGGRSVHALVRIDARTKGEWDDIKAELMGGLVTLGADPKAMTAVRLTRLPGCFRKDRLQKLLYIDPTPEPRALIDVFARRDVETKWEELARAGIADGDETGGRWLKDGLNYYATVSDRCKAALQQLK
ncbi:MAG: hypothetical protein B9S32_13740 [Verrucomicrobia bacterium Tous-C9LFEB]|nr:MAG: hypothetical protein B9S32_13740 [Verrucomicrobia bacterium Tous-C9LFEB]